MMTRLPAAVVVIVIIDSLPDIKRSLTIRAM
ncbi:hypothetical protein SAMN05444920_102937 [Nonomuraea solani]|uniref:Uncharacterized protein n=1 Tax=Nonomuraea solani TaxID=1144553 RepID=A0A1H5ZZX3_9ACTN|nr:hypothetical protein SAMN05444920_102937 [Nonomuraea solani]